jgi:hypothetical protein
MHRQYRKPVFTCVVVAYFLSFIIEIAINTSVLIMVEVQMSPHNQKHNQIISKEVSEMSLH